MKLRFLALITVLATLVSIAPVQAAEVRNVTGVSAYVRVDLGYLVGWTLPSDTKGITGYTVTANPGGKTCAASSNSTKCVFSTQALGFKDAYTFTVKAKTATEEGPASAPSNMVKYASIPWAPFGVVTKVISSSQIDVAWIPSPEDGGAPLYGYTITWWPMLANGDPDGSNRNSLVALKTNASLTGLKAGTPYIINVASCNAWGCNSADTWSYVATLKADGSATAFVKPRVISGGSATTTCWNATWDAGNASSASSTFTKATTKCAGVIVDPAKFPVIVPTATAKNDPVLATKFVQNMGINFNKTYSLSEWSKSGGFGWFAYVSATTKSVTLGFETPVELISTTPSVCTTTADRFIKFVAVGTCSINGSVAGNNAFLPATAKGSFTITP